MTVWSPSRTRTISRILLAAVYALVGILHITQPDTFLRITPDWVPQPASVIWLTGIAELCGAAGLLIPRRMIGWARPAAGIGLALYALCVWPANINHFVMDMALADKGMGLGYHVPRMFLQPVLIWLALWTGEVTYWPFKGGPPAGTSFRA